MNKEPFVTQLSFHFSPTSAHILPLQTIQQRIRGIYDSLSWPVVRRILKADLAVTIAFALMFFESVRSRTSYGIVLAQVAVQFNHPAKSHGALLEDIAVGTVMCAVSTAWSLLGTFCASLVRDPTNASQAQPKVAVVLVVFLLVGAFCLNYLRTKVEQANVGGMLSATILVISLTGAMLDTVWSPVKVLKVFLPVIVGFAIVFVIGVLCWPENSTRIYVQQLVRTLETFDGIAQRQIDGFLHLNAAPREQSVYPSSALSQKPQPESLPVVHREIDTHITGLVSKKRVVRREASINAIAPQDVSELTRLLKKMQVPLQGVALSRAMEDNMRKAQARRVVAARLKKFAAKDELDPIRSPDDDEDDEDTRSFEGHSFPAVREKPFSFPNNNINDEDDVDETDDEAIAPWMKNKIADERDDSNLGDIDLSDDDDEDREDDGIGKDEDKDRTSIAKQPNAFEEEEEDVDDDDRSSLKSQPSCRQPSPSTTRPSTSSRGDSGVKTWNDIKYAANTNDPLSCDTTFAISAWRREYDIILETVQPIYRELSQACSTAIHASIERLEYLQRIDPRVQEKPFIYRIFCAHKLGPAPEPHNRNVDPSVALLQAIHQFDARRLRGLEQLYHPPSKKNGRRTPRRILFLLLHFQFNLRNYAERVYTLSSLVYEMDQARTSRRLWLPHVSIRKWFKRRPGSEAEIGLDPPADIVETHFNSTMHRTLSRRTTNLLHINPMDLVILNEKADLKAPQRGSIGLKKHHRRQSSVTSPRYAWKDPMLYHDPDVAYPTTATQRFFYQCWHFWVNHIYTADTAFAFRACIVVMGLSLPAFLEDSIGWYNRARGQWAVVVALIWMGPSVGSNFFGVMVRTVGTFIGAICSLLIWEISRTNVAGMIVLTFVFNLPWWLIYLNGKFWKATGLFSLITTSIIVGYAYNYMMDGIDISVYEVVYERTIAVLAGVLAAVIISIFPFPKTGRVELRHRISRTLGDIGNLYSSFLALLLKNGQCDEKVRLSNRKVFRAVAADIRKQIKGERILLEQSRFEPALRGVFQEHKYVQILQALENCVHLLIDMEHALERIHLAWRMALVRDTWRERKNTIASFLTALHLAANSLSNKTPLPPYILRPTRARRELTNKARLIPNLGKSRLSDPEYTYYSAYLMSSEQLAVEIESLVSSIRDLVGPDSVSVWLDYRH